MTVMPYSVIVVNWNGARWIEKMADSLKNQTVLPKERILIDNGSIDNSEQILERQYPGWKLVKSKTNEGFARAANKGLNISTQPFILLLNTDVFLAPDYCERLLTFLLRNPETGGVMGLLKRADQERIDSVGIRLSRLRRRPVDIYSEKKRRSVKMSDQPFQIFGVNAAATILRRTMLESIEFDNMYFDEEYRSYFEDVDLCWRAHKAGWLFWCIPKAEAVHVRGGSGGFVHSEIDIRAYTNRFRLYLTHEPRRDFLLSLPLNLVVELYRIIIKPLLKPRYIFSLLQVIESLPSIRFRRDYYKNVNALPLPVTPQAIHTDKKYTIERPDYIRSPLITVIIVNYNTRKYLSSCLMSLKNGISQDCRVVVVDNASTDGSSDLVRQAFPQVKLISLPENRGFAKAVNTAIQSVPAQFYLLLNSDTIVSHHFPLRFAYYVDAMPWVGIASTLIRNSDGSLQLSWGDCPTLYNEFKQRRLHRLYRRGRKRTQKKIAREYAQLQSPDWVTGACLLIRHETVKHIGLMDESFFLYYEDIDWCLRAKKAGWTVLYTPEFSILHIGGVSAAKEPLHAAQHYRISQKLFYRKYFSRKQQFGLKLFSLFKGKRFVDQRKFKK